MSDPPKKKLFPSFKSAPKREVNECVDVSFVKPKDPEYEKPSIPFKRLAREMLGRSEELVYDIDRKGDTEFFKYGKLCVGEVPAYFVPFHDDESDRIGTQSSRPDFRQVEKEPSRRIWAIGKDMDGDFVPMEDVEEVLENQAEKLVAKQTLLNSRISRDSKDESAWLGLVDLQEELGGQQQIVIEKQMAILEKALRSSPSSDALRIKLLQCRSVILPYVEMFKEWTSYGKRSEKIALAFIDWLKHDAGLGKFNVADCIEAFEQMVKAHKKTSVELVSGFPTFLIEVDMRERAAFILEGQLCAMMHSYGFLWENMQEKLYTFTYNHRESLFQNWIRMEKESEVTYWHPRMRDVGDPLDPPEDTYRIVDCKGVHSFLSSELSDAAPFMEAIFDLLQLEHEFDPPAFLEFPGYDSVKPFPASLAPPPPSWKHVPPYKRLFLESMLLRAIDFTDRFYLSFLRLNNWFNPSVDHAKRRLEKDPDNYGLWITYTRFLRHEGHVDEAERLLKIILRNLQESCKFDKMGPVASELAVVLFANKDFAALQDLRAQMPDCRVEGLMLDALCSANMGEEENDSILIRCAENCDFEFLVALVVYKNHGHESLYELLETQEQVSNVTLKALWILDQQQPRFQSRLYKWLRTSAKPEYVEYILSLDAPTSAAHRQLANFEYFTGALRKRPRFWMAYVKFLAEHYQSKFKAVMYQAINACPYSKDLYLACIEHGHGRGILTDAEVTELISTMEEKGIRIRRLVEECSLYA